MRIQLKIMLTRPPTIQQNFSASIKKKKKKKGLKNNIWNANTIENYVDPGPNYSTKFFYLTFSLFPCTHIANLKNNKKENKEEKRQKTYMKCHCQYKWGICWTLLQVFKKNSASFFLHVWGLSIKLTSPMSILDPKGNIWNR